MNQWQLQDAKAKLSQLVKQANQDGPQTITVHGEPAAVLLSQKAFEALTSHSESFTQFMAHSPLKGLDLEIDRDTSTCREVDL